MNHLPESPDEPLRAALRAARPAPPLPPRFQEAVWRRIEGDAAPRKAAPPGEWLGRLAAWLLRPAPALAGIAAMLLVGVSIGLVQGRSLADELAKQQYLSAVSPFTTR